MDETQIHVGSGKRKHRLRRVLIGLGVVVLVAALALGAGVGVRWWQQQKEYERLGSPEVISKEALEAQNQTLIGNFDKAHETINEALDNPKLSNDAKYELIMQRAGAYEGQQKNDEAIESYHQAEAIKQTQAVAEALARMAEVKGDKELAISYYQKAISLIPDEDVAKEATKTYYDNKIFVLQGGVIKDE